MKLHWPDIRSLSRLSDHQRERAALATAGRLGILTGTPGTGKTYTTGAIVEAVVNDWGLDNVAIAAPTGKAAVRLTAGLRAVGLKAEATTIHRLLEVGRNGHDGKGWGFRRCESNPLPQRFVFLDEVSMLDTDLAANLFRALQPGTHVMMIGDIHQLPPVGHGAPLRDLIAAGIPTGKLDEIQRQAQGSDIIRVGIEISKFGRYNPSPYIDIAAGLNAGHIETQSAAETVDRIDGMLRCPPAGIDPIWDVQVLCALNDNSALARKPLNDLLQQHLNPRGQQVRGSRFRLGDKLICTSNGMLPVVEIEGQNVSEDGVRDFVANGEIGQVVDVEKRCMLVKFDAPNRVIRVPLAKSSGGSGEQNTQGEASDGTTTPAGSAQSTSGGSANFDLAYAITTHKAQGSQAPIIVTAIDDSAGAGWVCSREWWKTATSRMEKLSVTIGRRSTVDRHCKTVALANRKTFLREMLT